MENWREATRAYKESNPDKDLPEPAVAALRNFIYSDFGNTAMKLLEAAEWMVTLGKNEEDHSTCRWVKTEVCLGGNGLVIVKSYGPPMSPYDRIPESHNHLEPEEAIRLLRELPAEKNMLKFKDEKDLIGNLKQGIDQIAKRAP